MKNNKRKLKAIGLSFVLAAGMLLPMNIFAQDDSPGGLLNYNGASENQDLSLFGRGNGLFEGLSLQDFGENEDDLTLQNFGEAETPLGGGWLIMIASGIGYATMKSRKKQTKNGKTTTKH